jgi:hypothetical protein
MKLRPVVFIALGLVLLAQGCNDKKSTQPTDSFVNQLSLGTGMSGFNLVGETTAFHGVPVTITFRLESQADLEGSQVQIRVEKLVSGSYASFNTFSFPNPQSYGHILLSSFTIGETGQFRATGIKVSTTTAVASREFSVE